MKRFFQNPGRFGWKAWAAGLVVLVIVAGTSLCGLLYTEWFQGRIRHEMIAQIETLTGGEASLRELYFQPTTLRLRVEGLSVSSLDESEPFLEVPAAELVFKLESLFSTKLSLEALVLDSPRIHVIAASDGANNLPPFPLQPDTSGTMPQALFEMAVKRFDVNRGRFQWNDGSVPVSFSSQRFHLQTRFEPQQGRYRANVRLGESQLEIRNKRPVLSEAEAVFHVYPDRVVAPEIKWASGGTSVLGDLEINSLDQPQAVFRYRIDAQLREWASWLGLAPLAGGAALVRGEGQWNGAEGALRYTGRLTISDLMPQADQFVLEPVSATADFSGDAQTLSVQNIEAEALGGALTGEARLEGLTSTSPRYRLALALAEFPLKPLTAAVPQLPAGIRDAPWVSALSGTIEAEGSSSDDLLAQARIVFEAPQASRQHQVPLRGALDMGYESGSQTLRIDNFDLITAHSRIQLNGSLRAQDRAQLRVRADFTGLEDLRYWLRQANAEQIAAPVGLAGSVQLNGQVSGRLASQDLRFQGSLNVKQFTLHGKPWDRLHGSLDISPSKIRVEPARLESAGGVADISLTADLTSRETQKVSAVNGRVSIKNLPVASLLSSTAFDQPLTGALNGDVRFSGPPSNPQGSAHLELIEGVVWGWRLDRIVADARLAEGEVVVDSIRAELGQATLSGNGRVDRTTGVFHFKVAADGWNLGDLQTFSQSDHPPSGLLVLDLEGKGRLPSGENLFDDLVVSGSFGLEEVKLGERDIGSFSGKLTTSGRRVDLGWEGNLLFGSLVGYAEFRPDKNGPFSGHCTVKGLDLVYLAGLADLNLHQTSGTVDGQFRFSGEVTDAGKFVADGEVTRLQLTHSDIPGADRGYEVWNPFPMRWKVENKTLDIDRVRLIGDGTDIVVDGTIGLQDGFARKEDSMDVSVEGIFNLAALESFRPGVTASGDSELDVSIRGNADQPAIRGRMQVKDGTLRHSSFSNGLSELNGQIRFNEGMIRVEEVRAESGGGNLTLDGTVVLQDGRWDYRLQANIESVRVRYPESLSNVIDGRLTYSGTDLRSLLSGEVIVSRVTIGSDLTLGDVMASLAQPTQTPASNQVLVNMGLSVRIASVPELLIDTPLIRNVQSNMDLQLRGTAVSPSLLGDLTITQGELLFQGSRYKINRGDINFYNPFRIEPVVNIELETRIRDVDIALIISGPASLPNLSYRSDPPLRTDQLLDLIALARSPTTDPVLATQQTAQQQSLIQSGLNAVLSRAITVSGATSIGSRRGSQRLQRFFGVSRLKVDPQSGGAELNPGARISTEQQITQDLTLIYSYDLSEAQQQVVRVEWAPTRQWSFIVTRDENGLVGADILFKKRLH